MKVTKMSSPLSPLSPQDDAIARADAWRIDAAKRIGALEAQNVLLRKAVDDNTRICAATKVVADETKKVAEDTKKVADETKKNTDDIVDFFKGMRVVGALSKWLTTVSVVAVALWISLKGAK